MAKTGQSEAEVLKPRVAKIPLGRMARGGGDRQRGSVPGVRARELRHRQRLGGGWRHIGAALIATETVGVRQNARCRCCRHGACRSGACWRCGAARRGRARLSDPADHAHRLARPGRPERRDRPGARAACWLRNSPSAAGDREPPRRRRQHRRRTGRACSARRLHAAHGQHRHSGHQRRAPEEASASIPQLDFAPITLLGTQANVLVVHPALPANSLDAVDRARQGEAGLLTFASSGLRQPRPISPASCSRSRPRRTSSMSHTRSAAPALQDVVGGHVQMMFAPAALVANHVRAGRLRALAVATTPKRSPLLPGVATIDELGHPGFDATTWYGLVAPAGTPKEIIDVLYHSRGGGDPGPGRAQDHERPRHRRGRELAARVRSLHRHASPQMGGGHQVHRGPNALTRRGSHRSAVRCAGAAAIDV